MPNRDVTSPVPHYYGRCDRCGYQFEEYDWIIRWRMCLKCENYLTEHYHGEREKIYWRIAYQAGNPAITQEVCISTRACGRCNYRFECLTEHNPIKIMS